MKKIVQIYKKDHAYIVGHITGVVSSLPKDLLTHSKSVFKKYKYIELMYSVDSNYKQNSPSKYKKKSVSESIDSDKSQYFSNINLKDNDVFISSPYIHHTSGNPSISVVHRVGDIYYVMDINMILLFEELKLIEYNSIHEKAIKLVYIWSEYSWSCITLTYWLWCLCFGCTYVLSIYK